MTSMNATMVPSLHSSESSADNNVANEPSKSSFDFGKQHCNPIGRVPLPSGPQMNIPKKPMRPLTAYHVFFQIEREFIIQSLPDANKDTDEKSASNKLIFDDVPNRYKAIKLSPEWYFGPGKRPKRKHRKAHGKIGFMELSQIIASRWAELETLDPEVKAFVQKIAKLELDEYLADMKKYKELTKAHKPVVTATSSAAPRPVSSHGAAVAQARMNISTDRSLHPMKRLPDAAMSMQGNFQSTHIDLSNEIDYFISRINSDARQLLPAVRREFAPTNNANNAGSHFFARQERRNSLLTYLEPLFDTEELEQDSIIQQPSKRQRRNSPSSVTVDICDNEIIRMWKENNE